MTREEFEKILDKAAEQLGREVRESTKYHVCGNCGHLHSYHRSVFGKHFPCEGNHGKCECVCFERVETDAERELRLKLAWIAKEYGTLGKFFDSAKASLAKSAVVHDRAQWAKIRQSSSS